jgi:hypothetical protein
VSSHDAGLKWWLVLRMLNNLSRCDNAAGAARP